MKRTQRQAQRRFHSVCEYVYATTPSVDITPFLLDIMRAHHGTWSDPMTADQFDVWFDNFNQQVNEAKTAKTNK